MNRPVTKALLATMLVASLGAPALAQENGPIIAPPPPTATTEPPKIISAPTTAEITLRGTVEYVDLEGGFYAVDGWSLVGDEALFKSMLGQVVFVQGTEVTTPTIRMTKTVNVASFNREAQKNRSLPTGITLLQQEISYDQAPVVVDGVLMVPLRAVAEAAGGKVGWDAATRSITVDLSDRTAAFTVGSSEAEMNMRGVFYIRRNLLPLSHTPIIVGDRTLIPADALTTFFGLYEKADGDKRLNLSTKPSVKTLSSSTEKM